MAKKKYTVKNTNLLHSGTTYKIGDVIELDEEQGKKLVDILIPIEEDTDTSTTKITTKAPTAAKTKTTAKAKADAETTTTPDEVKDETTTETTDETVSNGTATTDASATDGGDK